ncbi:hypothetical protein Cylst_5635 [Cylindrospermum stagnale PCC 7417]|uniref:Uncharacterized protein n=1 Tax=Cylindrospermum stagnale PCC 7417 TaxID=56107 RepID=K9X6E1_9NOST|nr:DUF6585 family protein [Cylindrospermum stagnale]AFZ27636.1 hypothetical protein Cylst_5635 [Cylindrospermum stagnale PCC 7417]
MSNKNNQHLEDYSLGKLIKEFKPQISRKLIQPMVIALFFIIGGVQLISGGFKEAWITIIGLGCIIFSGFLIYGIVDILRERLFLYEDGLVYKSSNIIKIINFKDIVALWQYGVQYYQYFVIPTGRKSYQYTIQTKDGNAIILDEIIANEELGKYLNHEVIKYLMPSLKFNYSVGQSVTFGEITISKKGIKAKNNTLPWLEVESIDISSGKVYIRKKNGSWLNKNWYVAEVSTICNLYIFIEMTNTILSSVRP